MRFSRTGEAELRRLDLGVREAARPDRLLDSLLRLSDAADRSGRPLLVQPPGGKFNYTWQGFTWNNWRYWNGVPGIQSAIVLSLEIALIASLVATALGTLIALALVRYRFRGRAATNILIFLPLSTPEIVLGASLLTLFLHFTFVPFGFWTILIAHVMFCISFAVVTVKARLIGFDRHLEEAAMDLGANEWTTFRKVTLPLITPAILAAFLLCFAISVDDFVVTYFNAGTRSRSRSTSGARRASARRRRST